METDEGTVKGRRIHLSATMAHALGDRVCVLVNGDMARPGWLAGLVVGFQIDIVETGKKLRYLVETPIKVYGEVKIARHLAEPGLVQTFPVGDERWPEFKS